VISQIHRRHRAVDFKKFLVEIDKAVPTELDVHLVCDNLATPKKPAVNDWLGKHPRSTSISPRPVPPGSTRWNAGLATSPTSPYAACSQKCCRTGERRPRLDHQMEHRPEAIRLDQDR
jgi:hypothetical protein